jgi:3-carboxy-cis,cis-muconate cycloisomerase
MFGHHIAMTTPALHSFYGDLMVDPATAAAFTGEAELAAMLRVEVALARVQAQSGLIPAEAAEAIAAHVAGVRLTPEQLAAGTAIDGVPVPTLVAALRRSGEGNAALGWIHWGATSQDILDTGLALRLAEVIALWQARLDTLIDLLGRMAEAHADLAMAGRTYGQAATPTSFGALVASWGRPLVRHRDRLAALMPDLLMVSVSGAAGTSAAMGPDAAAVRSGLATALGLADPGASWHAERDGIAAFGQWMAGVTASLAKMGADLVTLSQTGIGEVRLAGAGGSSTMPQKQNPVGPSLLVALAPYVSALSGALNQAVVHRLQRDGSAWFTEWLALPQAAMATGRALALSLEVASAIAPDAEAMAAGLHQGGGTIFAEAVTFALARRMPRPDAARIVAALSRRALAGEGALLDLVAMDYPDEDWQSLTGPAALGLAPQEARAFAREATEPHP